MENRYYAKYTQDEIAHIRKYAGKLPAKEIGQMIGRTHHSIYRAAKRYNIQLVRRGQYHQTSKYPASVVRQAVKLHNEGVPYKEICRRLNVNRSTLGQWINGVNRSSDVDFLNGS